MISNRTDGNYFNDYGRVPRNALCPCGSGAKAKKCHEGYTRSPLPGLDGTYKDSCLLCLRGTDEIVGFWGEAEWYCAVLLKGGLSEPEIERVLQTAHGDDAERPNLGAIHCRVCLFCQRKLGLPKPEHAPLPGQTAVYVQPKESMTLQSQFALAQAQAERAQADADTAYCDACKKTSFATERSAARRIKEFWSDSKPNSFGRPHRAYACPHGNGWHLTRRPLGGR